MNIKKVPISDVESWAKNPKNIRTKDFERLKKQIQELGIYKPLICTQENGKYITLGLIQRALRNSSRPKEIVLDPFAGSGSTIVAAEREGRIAYAMDLDPIYIDVMIRRYAALGAQTEKEIRATKREIPQEKPK